MSYVDFYLRHPGPVKVSAHAKCLYRNYTSCPMQWMALGFSQTTTKD